MLRRAFLLSLFRANETTPRNRAAVAANDFNAQWATWANAMNQTRDGNLHYPEVAAWEPLPRLFRAVEAARNKWIEGFR